MLFITNELNQRCTEIQEQLDLILTQDRPNVTLNGVMIYFDDFDILLITENTAYLKLKMHGEKVAFIDLDNIQDLEE